MNNLRTDNSVAKITFSYTKDEYIKSRRKFLRISNTISNGNIVFLIVMTILEIVFLIIHEFFFGLIVGMLLIISYLLVFVLYFIYPQRIYEKNKYLKEKIDCDILDMGIRLRRGKIDSLIEWKNIKAIYESNDFLYLIQDKVNYILIPKRAIKNKYDLVTIQKLYNENNKDGTYNSTK